MRKGPNMIAVKLYIGTSDLKNEMENMHMQ